VTKAMHQDGGEDALSSVVIHPAASAALDFIIVIICYSQINTSVLIIACNESFHWYFNCQQRPIYNMWRDIDWEICLPML